MIQGGQTRAVIHGVRSTPTSREASPAPKTSRDKTSPKKLLQTSSLRLPGKLNLKYIYMYINYLNLFFIHIVFFFFQEQAKVLPTYKMH